MIAGAADYTPLEFSEIHAILGGDIVGAMNNPHCLSEEERTVSLKNILMTSVDCALASKIDQDALFQRYDIARFFPGMLEILWSADRHDSDIAKVIQFEKEDLRPHIKRRFIDKIGYEEKSFVIKPIKSEIEHHIAVLLGEELLGPRQYPSIERFLSEEFINGLHFREFCEGLGGADEKEPTSLFSLKRLSKRSKETMTYIGEFVGKALKTMHDLDIIYSNSIIGDYTRPGHLIIPMVTPLRGPTLLDFGQTITIGARREKRYSDEDAFNYMLGDRKIYAECLRCTSKDSLEAFKKKQTDIGRKYLNNLSDEALQRRDVMGVLTQVSEVSQEHKTNYFTSFCTGFVAGYPQYRRAVKDLMNNSPST